jgi:hypothetical protein
MARDKVPISVIIDAGPRVEGNLIKTLLKGLIPVILIASFTVVADTKQMDEAVKRYYAGFPEEAISMIEPLALSGDIDAQYLLGNILYSLSKVEGNTDIEDPVKWYKMAAEQNSAVANYALGAIFHNRWIKSRSKNEAANAIVYYQTAIESGYSKAQQPLNRIKSRSRVSPEAAAILVKEQEETLVPKAESSVQMPEVDTSSLESDESQAPDSGALTKKHTTIKSESVDKPEVAVEVPIAIAQIADKPDDEVTVSVIKSEPLDKPEVAVKDPIKIAQIADKPDDEVAVSGIKSEPLDKPEVTAKDPIKIVQIADKPDDEITVTVTLEEIASQCQKYTATGFDFYADTIEGALLSGTASVVAVKPDSAEPGTFLISLSSKLFGLVVFVDLHDVPKEVAVKFEDGNEYAITGIVVNSKTVDSDCAVRAMYQ